jgi:hypothetical protein
MEVFENFKLKFPEQFKNIGSKYGPSGIECREGWSELIHTACSLIQNHLDHLDSKNKKIEFYWTQIKSKFAGLRLYYSGGDEYISGVVNMAESFSYNVCEFCGEKGVYCKRGNWVDTLCDTCQKEHEYEVVKK